MALHRRNLTALTGLFIFAALFARTPSDTDGPPFYPHLSTSGQDPTSSLLSSAGTNPNAALLEEGSS
jgi:hypothetical protein